MFMYNCVNVHNIVITTGIHVPSLELFDKTVLDILEERAFLMFNQGQWVKVTNHCHLHRYTCTTSDIICPNCCWDTVYNKSCFHVFDQSQRSRSRVEITDHCQLHRYTYIPSLKFLAQPILEIWREWAIFMCFINHATLNWPLTLTLKLTKISLKSGKTCLGIHLPCLKKLPKLLRYYKSYFYVSLIKVTGQGQGLR